ncbi:MAG: hypothetical protein GX149_06045 [Acholeplasmataceae bacterium]|jgi:glycerophosphoryl diester phosphodiesterase|nr:hypothetical protein [Acholeplasmataceae bacterium]
MSKMIYITDNKEADINYIKDSNTITVFKGLNLIEVHHPANATQSAVFLKLLNHFDIFILSRSRRALIEAQEIFQYTRLVYEPRRKITDIDKLARRIFSIRCFTICLPAECATQEMIRKFHVKGIKVIIRAQNQTDVYKAALAGADGVLGKDLKRVEIESDLTTLPFLVSHRGYQVDQVENSIKAGLKAHQHNADVLELDVHLTEDKKIVVNHDPTLGRTYDKDYVIKINKLAELKQARQKLNETILDDRIATLTEFDKELPEDLTFLVETKVEGNHAIKRLSRIVNSMKRNVMVMSFYPIALIRMDSYIKNNINGLLLASEEENMELLPIIKVVNKYKLIIHPQYSKFDYKWEQEIKRRMIGYSPWGIKEEDLEDALFEHHDMINSNFVHLLAHLPKKIVTKREIIYSLGDKKQLQVSNEKGKKLKFKTRILFDNPLELTIENGVITGAGKTGTTYLYVTHGATIFKKKIHYASDLIKVTVVDSEENNNGPN